MNTFKAVLPVMILTALTLTSLGVRAEAPFVDMDIKCEDLLRGGLHVGHRAAYGALSRVIDQAERPLEIEILDDAKIKAKEAFGLTHLTDDELGLLKLNPYFEETERHAGAALEIFVDSPRGIDQLDVFRADFSKANLYLWRHLGGMSFEGKADTLSPQEFKRFAENAEVGVILQGPKSGPRRYMSVQRIYDKFPLMTLGLDVPCKDLASFAKANAKVRQVQTAAGTLCRVPVLQILLK